jgi:hypothetical protein
MSAGARLIVIRPIANGNPEFRIALETRSLLSFTASSGKPTTQNAGTFDEISVSTSTLYASIPSIAADVIRENICYI